jgi:hypothetical protein
LLALEVVRAEAKEKRAVMEEGMQEVRKGREGRREEGKSKSD